MRKDAENFMLSAAYDLQTAEAMLGSGRHIYVVFMCHIAIEKMLKAVAAQVTKAVPPKTHNLIYLLKLGNVQLDQDMLDFIARLNNASLVTRYPEDFSQLVTAYPADVAVQYLEKTREVIAWLKTHEKLQTS